jgi:Na+/glutamate symporter
MEYFIIGATFGILFGFAVGILFNGLLRTTKTKREQAAKQRMYFALKELEIEKIMLDMATDKRLETEKKIRNNVIPFKKRTEDDIITE